MNQRQEKPSAIKIFEQALDSHRKIQNIIIQMEADNALVTRADLSVCKLAGESLDNKLCTELGECSWYRHSQDSFTISNKSNLPEWFIEP